MNILNLFPLKFFVLFFCALFASFAFYIIVFHRFEWQNSLLLLYCSILISNQGFFLSVVNHLTQGKRGIRKTGLLLFILFRRILASEIVEMKEEKSWTWSFENIKLIVFQNPKSKKIFSSFLYNYALLFRKQMIRSHL